MGVKIKKKPLYGFFVPCLSVYPENCELETVNYLLSFTFACRFINLIGRAKRPEFSQYKSSEFFPGWRDSEIFCSLLHR